MKKAFMILAVIMLAIMPICMAEEYSLTGTWYASFSDALVQLVLNEDNTYILKISGEEPIHGTWEEQDGYLSLDGVQPPEIIIVNEMIIWREAGLIFGHESTGLYYTPAETTNELSPERIGGYWKSTLIDEDGVAIPAGFVNDKTDLYIDGNGVILGGPVFGDVLVKAAYRNGTLTCEKDGKTIQLQLQQDGIMRLTLSGEGENKIWYMVHADTAVPDSDKEE